MSVLCERHFQLRTAQAGPTMPPKPQCLDCLRAEVEKLREALRHIADHYGCTDSRCTDARCRPGNFARAALASDRKEEP